MKLPYQVVLRSTTASEFIGWLEYFRQEDREKYETVEKQDMYFAQLMAEVRRSWVCDSDRKKVKAEDFVLRFADKPVEKKPRSKEEQTRISKAFWLGHLMAGGKKTAKGKKGK